MQTAELTIQGKTFQAPTPYTAGHVLTDVEASVLNQTFLENLRNNFGAKMKKAFFDGATVPGAAEFAEYAAQYKFGLRQVGERVERDPIKTEARKLIREKLTAALKAKGHKVKDLEEGKLAAMIEEALTKHPQFLQQAAAIVEARKAAATDLSSLDLSA